MTFWLLLSLLLLQQQQQSSSPLADLAQPGTIQPVTGVSFTGKELVSAFNTSADRVRLVLVLSPT